MIGLEDLPLELPGLEDHVADLEADLLLARATAPRSPDTVEVLEELLEAARAGRIDGIAVAYTFRDGGVGTVWDFDAGANLPALVGAGAALQFRLARALVPDALELDSDDPDQESLDE